VEERADHAGLPFWQAVVLSTGAIRLSLLPVVINQQKEAFRMQSFAPQIKEMQETMRKAFSENDTVTLERVKLEQIEFNRKNRINPLGMFKFLLIQVPIFMTMFWALKSPYLKVAHPSIVTDGLFWSADLSVADPLYILPGVNAMLIWLTFYMTPAPANQPPIFKAFMNVLTWGLPPLIFLGGSTLPSVRLPIVCGDI
jgi:YidC/Oxa1 family membrane protein insertase